MNLNEYKELKKKEIEHFFRGIYFENIGKNGEEGKPYDIIIENGIYDLDFINTNKVYRKIIEETLRNIKSYCTDVRDTGIEFSTSKEEVDKEVETFVENVMSEMTKLKEKILDKFYREKSSKKEQSSLLDTNLDIIDIKLGKQVYSKNNNNSQEENNEMIIDDIRNILAYVVSLPNIIKDKKNKLQEVHNLILSNYEVGTIPYMQVLNHYGKIYKERNYQNFNTQYNEIMDRFFKDSNQTLSGETKPKSRG